MNPLLRPFRSRFALTLPLVAFAGLVAVSWPAVAKPDKAEVRELKREMAADAAGGKGGKRDDAGGKAGRASSDAAARALSKWREQLEVTDDAEWDVIGERILKVEELRRSLWTGGPSSGDRSKKGARSGGSGHPEQDALREAVGSKLPDAEIRARLARAHDVFQQNELKLARARDELRAVLSVRQEAVAVMIGLLPP